MHSTSWYLGAAVLILMGQPVHAQSFERLGVLPGAVISRAYAVSADGSVVVGESGAPFRWTRSGGLVSLGVSGSARGVSADGSVVVGWALVGNGSRAFRWTQQQGIVFLGALPGHVNSEAHAVSADGSVVVGSSGPFGNSRAFRWTAAGGMQDLGTLGGNVSIASAVSADGAVVVGGSTPAGSTWEHAFRWTAKGGMQDLGTFGGQIPYSWAQTVSSDGSVVVGWSNTPAATRAFRWTPGEGMVALPALPTSGTTHALGVSADGTSIVGKDFSGGARRWDAGIVDLSDYLGIVGVQPTMLMKSAHAISADGRAIVGIGSGPELDEAWVVYLGGECYADCYVDGSLNVADLQCYQSRFGLGDHYADCNNDGSINLADFGCFQTKFALGCP